MDAAALVLAIVALIVSIGSMLYSRRVADVETGRAKRERHPIIATRLWSDGQLDIRLDGPEAIASATFLPTKWVNLPTGPNDSGPIPSALTRDDAWKIGGVWTIACVLENAPPWIEFELTFVAADKTTWTRPYGARSVGSHAEHLARVPQVAPEFTRHDGAIW